MRAFSLIILGKAVVLVGQGVAMLFPRLGAKTLIIPGALAMVGVLGSGIYISLNESVCGSR